MVFETVMEVPMKDEDHDTSVLICDCEDAWRGQFEKATESQKEEMHSWYWAHRTSVQPKGISDLDRIFLSLPWSDSLHQKNVELFISTQTPSRIVTPPNRKIARQEPISCRACPSLKMIFEKMQSSLTVSPTKGGKNGAFKNQGITLMFP